MDQVTYGIIPVAVAVFLASWTYSWLTVPNDTKNLKKAKDAGKVAPFNDIPGPVPVPIVGSVGKMISHAMNKRIDNFFNEVNETYGSVARVSIAGKNFLVLSDAAALKQILNNYGEVNRDARLVKAFEGILTYSIGIMPHGDLWMRHRKGLQPAFGPSHMKDAFGITLKVVDELADIWANRISLGEKTRDVYEDATLMTSDVIARFSMGLGVDGVKNAETRTRPELLQLLEPMFRVFIRRFYIVDFKFLWGFIGASVESVEPSITRVREILQGPIDAKRDELLKLPKESGKDHIEYWKKDVMERLLSPALKLAREEDVVFSEKEILDEIFSFYLAGYETTALATTISLYELCKHPDVQQRLREEIDRVYDSKHFELDTLNNFTYLDAVVKEIMRLHSVTPQITRIITNPLELDCDEGYKVLLPKGTEVIVNISMLHKNKALWGDDALEFRPERWLEGKVTTGMYYPFGGGHFVCLGQKLATIEIKLFLIRVLQRFEFKLADKFVPEFEYVGTCGIRSLSVDLRVRS